MFVVWKQSFLT